MVDSLSELLDSRVLIFMYTIVTATSKVPPYTPGRECVIKIMRPQGWYKTYNDIHNKLYQSEHAQSSCKLKRVVMSGNIDVHVRYKYNIASWCVSAISALGFVSGCYLGFRSDIADTHLEAMLYILLNTHFTLSIVILIFLYFFNFCFYFIYLWLINPLQSSSIHHGGTSKCNTIFRQCLILKYVYQYQLSLFHQQIFLRTMTIYTINCVSF